MRRQRERRTDERWSMSGLRPRGRSATHGRVQVSHDGSMTDAGGQRSAMDGRQAGNCLLHSEVGRGV